MTTRPPGIPGATNVDHVAYTVPDLDQAVAFFTDVLGAELIYREGPVQDPDGDTMSHHLGVHPRASARIAMLRLGPVTNLELFAYESPDQRQELPANSDWGGHHLAIHVTDIDEAARYLRDQPGVQLLGSPRAIPEGPIAGNRWLYFRTPWGMQMELVQAAENLPYERGTRARRYGPSPVPWYPGGDTVQDADRRNSPAIPADALTGSRHA
ncbi:VOC family protein [Streptomyces sp. RKAG337]|uniref:VOC family protein n=1 Tax=Streptomyces sp. RKAG337 TaxID=2893404 RepID=UPI002034297B|nr:VOC family protein [Streptomyces sp. RKAG337]MCM2427192.1 VOC family protein [Streptomyces sp. RKAG337]